MLSKVFFTVSGHHPSSIQVSLYLSTASVNQRFRFSHTQFPVTSVLTNLTAWVVLQPWSSFSCNAPLSLSPCCKRLNRLSLTCCRSENKQCFVWVHNSHMFSVSQVIYLRPLRSQSFRGPHEVDYTNLKTQSGSSLYLEVHVRTW